MLLISTADTHHLEAFGQLAFVGEVVQAGQQLAVSEVPGGAEDHERRGMNRQPLQTFDQWILGLFPADGLCHVCLSRSLRKSSYPSGQLSHRGRHVTLELDPLSGQAVRA